jgi:GNAT superfamily N-acetyltransferase
MMGEKSPMDIQFLEEPIATLAEQAQVSIAFKVDRVFDVEPRADSPGEFVLRERSLDIPYWKDYDAISEERPADWAKRFDVSNWGLIVARFAGRRVGGAVIAFNTAGLTMLEGRHELAVLWDIRVSPEIRGGGVGAGLFRAAEAWALARGSRRLKVETQNINVAACRFYAKQGCELKAIQRFAYPQLPEETQLLWYKNLSATE